MTDKVSNYFPKPHAVGAVQLSLAFRFAHDSAGDLEITKLDFELLLTMKILDRVARVRFHKCMVATGLQQALVHGLVRT